MKLVLEGYKGKYPGQRRGRGRWYRILEREATMLSPSTVEVSLEDVQLARDAGYMVARWRIVVESSDMCDVTVKINGKC